MTDVLPRDVRDGALDAVRGLAVALMLVDHLGWFLGVVEVRLTLGRLALPLFFVLAGHLATRVTSRHFLALGCGLVLTVLAPWAGTPNVLVQWFVCVLLVVFLRRWPAALAVVVLSALTAAANGVASVAVGYDWAACLGLVAFGALLPRSAFAWGRSLPSPLVLVGRRPLTVYVGHVLVLTTLWRLLS